MDMSFLRYVSRQGCKRSTEHTKKRFGYDCLTLIYTEYRRAYGNSIIYACGDYVRRSSVSVRTQRSVKQESHGFNRVECQGSMNFIQSLISRFLCNSSSYFSHSITSYEFVTSPVISNSLLFIFATK